MEHEITKNQLEILSGIDFIIPLKQVDLITRTIVEALELFYQPRRIIIITPKKEVDILKNLHVYWDVGDLQLICEEEFFIPNFGLTIDDILQEYDITREGEQREPGWWIQQLIKLGASSQIHDISQIYIVWDGDLLPTRRWKLCDYNEKGDVQYYFAILQAESRSEFNSYQYAACMKALTNMSPNEPEKGGTFVAHHMIFNKERVTEMLDLMIAFTGSGSIPWPKLIMSYSRKFYRFSEYKTYATFMTNKYPEEFYYHLLNAFGAGGLRFREKNEIVDKLLKDCPIIDGGIPYNKFKIIFDNTWKRLTGANKDIYPGYIQIEHVYGIDSYNNK